MALKTVDDVLARLQAGGTRLFLLKSINGGAGARLVAAALAQCNALKELNLGFNSIGDDGAHALADKLPLCSTLQTLVLGNNGIGADGARTLADKLPQCLALQTLDLHNNNIGADGARALADKLPQCSALQTLNLDNNSIGADGVRDLADKLPLCILLHTIDLGHNSIGAEGAHALADKLPLCSALQTLQLGSNSIGADGVRDLADKLPLCILLHTIDLGFNSIGADGARAVADKLPQCLALQTLYLYFNSIGADGARALADKLPLCTALQTLNLSSNSIGAVGARALADKLALCTALQNLDLGSNKIGADGARALADKLPLCLALQTLDLCSNSIGADGARALADKLPLFLTLKSLNLMLNMIGDEGARAILEMLPNCFALRELSLNVNKISNQLENEINAELKKNTQPDRVEQAEQRLKEARMSPEERAKRDAAQAEIQRQKAEHAARLKAEADERDRRLTLPAETWTDDDVAHLFAKFNLANLVPDVRKQAINGEALAGMDAADFMSLGVPSLGEAKRLVAKMAALRGDGPGVLTCSKWTEDEVVAWLGKADLKDLAAAFRKAHIAGDVLAALDTKDLGVLGVKKMGEAKKVLAKIAEVAQPAPGEYGVLGPAARAAIESGSVNLIARSEVTLFGEVGRGNFGIAYKAKYNSFWVVAKMATGDVDAKRKEAADEAAMMQRVCNPPNPNVLLYYGIVLDEKGVLLVSEHCSLGALSSFLTKEAHAITELQRLAICVHIAQGMKHIHGLNILHRDLAARNVLVSKAADGVGLIAKVADFGLSRNSQNQYNLKDESQVPFRWSAPEVILNRIFYKGSDVWSFGVTVWEVYESGRLPYYEHNTDTVIKGVVDKTLGLSRPERCASKVWSIVKEGCFPYVSHERLPFAELADRLRAELPPAAAAQE